MRRRGQGEQHSGEAEHQLLPDPRRAEETNRHLRGRLGQLAAVWPQQEDDSGEEE